MNTDRFSLPLVYAGQAQKEMTVNEAMARIDLLLGATVDSFGLDTPPSAPALGQCWIVGSSPTGDWTDHAGAVAGWTAGGWRFVVPRAGLTVWVVDQGLWAAHNGSIWVVGVMTAQSVMIDGDQVLSHQQSAISDPSGGSVIDSEARDKIVQLLNALREHGLISP